LTAVAGGRAGDLRMGGERVTPPPPPPRRRPTDGIGEYKAPVVVHADAQRKRTGLIS
jgi:hypothetical protein